MFIIHSNTHSFGYIRSLCLLSGGILLLCPLVLGEISPLGFRFWANLS